MKRYLVIALILFIFSGLLLGGDRLLGRILDARLPPLLTTQLGLPVSLEPINANIMSLTARTPRLVMGPAESPAVIATDVTVSLDWSDLLRGEIRLIDGSGADLTLQLSNWPRNKKPWPTDYTFLDQWLPRSLALTKGRYIDQYGKPYPVHNALWQRGAEGASVAWQENRLGGDVQLEATLDSLFGLLRLEPITLGLTLSKPGEANSSIVLKGDISPAQPNGYDIALDVQVATTKGHVQMGSDKAWELPTFSRTVLDRIQIDELIALTRSYRETSQDPNRERSLAAQLPELRLPDHQGSVSVNEVLYKDELGKDTTFVFNTGATGLEVTELVSSGPRGTLSGVFTLLSGTAGWDIKLEAEMKIREADQTLAPHYLSTDWIWQQGQARLDGKGSRWNDLLGSLDGNIELNGYYRGEVNTPVAITAQLDNTTEDFRLHDLDIQLGAGRITGEIILTEKQRPLLKMTLQGEQLDLDFLYKEDTGLGEPGIIIPEYLGFIPSIDLDGKFTLKQISAPAMQLASADIELLRSPSGGSLLVNAEGVNNGSLELQLRAQGQGGESRAVTLTADLTKMDLAELFQQDMNLHSRSTGNLAFAGTGVGLTSIFNSLQGTARLSTEFRRDDNWQRNSSEEEVLEVAGDATLLIEENRMVGVQLDHLDIDSIRQDVTGTLTMRTDSEPWLTAEFVAEKLDVDGLIALLPDSAAEADRTDLLTFLKQLGAARMSLSADSLRLSQQSLSALKLEVSSAEDQFDIKQLDFTHDGSPLTSSGGMTWAGKAATLEAKASISDFELDRFLVPNSTSESVPVSGTFDIRSEGESISQLLGSISGRISLADNQQGANVDETQRRRVEINANRVKGGMHAEVTEFQWGRNSLKGSFRYKDGDRPSFDVTIDSGTLELETWEKSLDKEQPEAKEKQGSLLAATARTSAKLVNDILRSPARLFSGPSEIDAGGKMFNENPLPFEALQGYDAVLRGQLTSIKSRAGQFSNLTLKASLQNGEVKLDARSESLNGGPGEMLMKLDTLQTPATVALSGNFRNVRSADGKPSFPRSGFFSVSSRGNTSAQLAANLDGQIYLELGQGPFDYVNFSMFTSDVATEIARALLPGVEKRKPELECGVVLEIFEEGVGRTPVGYTLRTDKANLIGRMELDLRKEEVTLAIDSRSREGVGLSVGNVFSNTIRVKGPLNDPQVVPHTTSILWRGWAAFMTAGLSVVGESVLKRAMAAENPCKSIKKDIRKQACGTGQPIASSDLVCG